MADYRFYLDRVLTKKMAQQGLLLDIYPTTGFAYSISRELISNQNKVITAIKTDDVTQDFSISEILSGDLVDFSEGGDVRLRHWNSVNGSIYSSLNSSPLSFGIRQPHLVQNGVLNITNNIPEIRFIDIANVNSSETSDSFTESDFTWYLVFKSQSTVSAEVPISECEINTSFNGSSPFSDTRPDGLKYNYRPQNTSYNIQEANTTLINTVYVYAIRRTGNIIEHFSNGVKTGQVNVSEVFVNPTTLKLGARGANRNGFSGAFNETIMHPESQSNTVMNAIIQNQMDYYL